MGIRRSNNLGYVIDCRGAWLRPHARATTIQLIVSGRVDASNRDVVQTSLARFIKLGESMILDLEGADLEHSEATALLNGLAAECARQSVPHAAVLDPRTGRLLSRDAPLGFPLFRSVAEAVAHFGESTRVPEHSARVVPFPRKPFLA
ncbi:hypothetical protein ACAG24_023360 [Mycobacterium sp. pW049]|uniref:hypothetical protein n=1 Tax=[Mycobacterium] bulgaricum TaxID=3238985 RepID=UPI00351B7B0D